MIQRFLAVVLPLILPFLLYGIYVYWAKATGRDLKTQDKKLKPLVWCLGSGLALMVVFLVVFRFYIDPDILSHPDNRHQLDPRPPTSFPSEYGSPR